MSKNKIIIISFILIIILSLVGSFFVTKVYWTLTLLEISFYLSFFYVLYFIGKRLDELRRYGVLNTNYKLIMTTKEKQLWSTNQ